MPERIKKIIEKSPRNDYFSNLNREPVNRLVHWLDKDFVNENYETYGILGLTAIDYLYQSPKINESQLFIEPCKKMLMHRKTSLSLNVNPEFSSQDLVVSVLIYNEFKTYKKQISKAKDIYDLKALCFLEYFDSLVKCKPLNNLEDMAISCSKKFFRKQDILSKNNLRGYNRLLKKYHKKKYHYYTLDNIVKLKKNSLILSDFETYNELNKFENFVKIDLEKDKFRIWTQIGFRKLIYALVNLYGYNSLNINIGIKNEEREFLEKFMAEPINLIYEFCSFFTENPELVVYGSASLFMAFLTYKLLSKNF